MFLVPKTPALCKTPAQHGASWSIPVCLSALQQGSHRLPWDLLLHLSRRALIGSVFSILDFNLSCICLRWMSCCLSPLFPPAFWKKRNCSPFLPWGYFFYQGHLSLVNTSHALLGASTWLCTSSGSATLPCGAGSMAVYHLLCTQMLELLFLA